MKELMRRLFRRPGEAVRLLLISFGVNVLSLASPLFVMLILSTYINSGFDDTLITLSSGMFIALLLQLCLKELRTRRCADISEEPDRRMAAAVFDVLSRAKPAALERMPQQARLELPNNLQNVQTAYSAVSLGAVLDAPFTVLFIGVCFLLHPVMGLLGFVMCLIALGAGVASPGLTKKINVKLQRAASAKRQLFLNCVHGAEIIRAFHAAPHLRDLWSNIDQRTRLLRLRAAGHQERFVAVNLTLHVLTRVVIYAVGAKLCVEGVLTFPALIASSILVSRALTQVSAFTTAFVKISEAGPALKQLSSLTKLPMEHKTGSTLHQYTGRLELRDLAFAYPGGSGPLFESLSLSLDQGSILGVHGVNGAGKTTLARVVVGLLDPIRGEIFADGVSLRQTLPAWWRKQVMYVPQEPVFLEGTILDNLIMPSPDIGQDELERIVAACGLQQCLVGVEGGLQAKVLNEGRNLPMGVRKRMALARAMVGAREGGALAVFDEPAEGLDVQGAETIAVVIKQLAAAGKTIILLSHDPKMLRGSTHLINLNIKPVPKVQVAAKAGASESAQTG